MFCQTLGLAKRESPATKFGGSFVNYAGGGSRTLTGVSPSVFETDVYAIPPLQRDLYIFIFVAETLTGVNPMIFETTAPAFAGYARRAGRYVVPSAKVLVEDATSARYIDFYFSASDLKYLSISRGRGKTMMDDFSVEMSISVCR